MLLTMVTYFLVPIDTTVATLGTKLFSAFKVYYVKFNACNSSHLMLSTNSHNITACFVPIVTTVGTLGTKLLYLIQSQFYDIQCL